MVNKGLVKAAISIKHGGIARAICEMAFGNMIGFKFEDIDKDQLFKPLFGSIILELAKDADLAEELKGIDYQVLGRTQGLRTIDIAGESIGQRG